MPITAPPTIAALPSPPDPNNRATFNTLAYPWSVAQQTLATEVGAVAANVYSNAQEAQTQASASAASAASANAAKLAAQAAQAAAEGVVATIPDGTINDTTTSALSVWSSQKVSAELGGKASTAALANKQDTLVSGTNIKTLNGASLLGSGNIAIEASVGDHAVRVTTGNGLGSTNTQIRRFTTTLASVGTAITYADSATNGASFTINEAGIYAVVYMDEGSGGGNAIYGVSLNSNQLTTDIYLIAATNRKTTSFMTAGLIGAASAVFRAGVGDVVRAHVGPLVMETTASKASFEIRKVAV